MKKHYLYTILLSISICFAQCKKDTNSQCLLLEDYDSLKKESDAFLSSLDNNLTDTKKLYAFQKWFETQGCVTKAEILCNSCIETLPVQSEMRIDYLANGIVKQATIDIIMSKPLKIGSVHE